jgi:hypothetical protein
MADFILIRQHNLEEIREESQQDDTIRALDILVREGIKRQ